MQSSWLQNWKLGHDCISLVVKDLWKCTLGEQGYAAINFVYKKAVLSQR